uniref:Coiled-coil domain-containing protein 25 n=1 Tax=Junco hyemalis TaxID=40217 RepID=A0A8C5IZP0_JUNHY
MAGTAGNPGIGNIPNGKNVPVLACVGNCGENWECVLFLVLPFLDSRGSHSQIPNDHCSHCSHCCHSQHSHIPTVPIPTFPLFPLLPFPHSHCSHSHCSHSHSHCSHSHIPVVPIPSSRCSHCSHSHSHCSHSHSHCSHCSHSHIPILIPTPTFLCSQIPTFIPIPVSLTSLCWWKPICSHSQSRLFPLLPFPFPHSHCSHSHILKFQIHSEIPRFIPRFIPISHVLVLVEADLIPIPFTHSQIFYSRSRPSLTSLLQLPFPNSQISHVCLTSLCRWKLTGSHSHSRMAIPRFIPKFPDLFPHSPHSRPCCSGSRSDPIPKPKFPDLFPDLSIPHSRPCCGGSRSDPISPDPIFPPGSHFSLIPFESHFPLDPVCSLDPICVPIPSHGSHLGPSCSPGSHLGPVCFPKSHLFPWVPFGSHWIPLDPICLPDPIFPSSHLDPGCSPGSHWISLDPVCFLGPVWIPLDFPRSHFPLILFVPQIPFVFPDSVWIPFVPVDPIWIPFVFPDPIPSHGSHLDPIGFPDPLWIPFFPGIPSSAFPGWLWVAVPAIPGLEFPEFPEFLDRFSRCSRRFHVDKLSSAHVYLRLHQGQTMDDIPKEVLSDCAHLVKANSIQGTRENGRKMGKKWEKMGEKWEKMGEKWGKNERKM